MKNIFVVFEPKPTDVKMWAALMRLYSIFVPRRQNDVLVHIYK